MAANKVDKLTPEQEAMLPIIRDEWYAHGLNTDPANREEAERGVNMVYKDAEEAEPNLYLWAKSPLAGAYAVTALVDDKFGIDQIVYKLDASVKVHGEFTIKESGSDKIEVTLKLDDKWPGRKHKYACKIQKNDAYNHIGRRIGGQYWAGYYAYFDAMDRLGLEKLDKIEGQLIVAKNANWWWALDKATVLVERPERSVSMDEEGRLHHDTDACIKYREDDGRQWGVYAHHGVRIPPGKEFIFTDPDKVTAEVILKEDNAELRRVMLEKVGYERIVDNMTLIDDDPAIGKLWRMRLPGDEDLALVDVTDPSTGRRYLLRVDPNAYGGLKTARAASASTWREPDGSMVFEKPEDYVLVAEA